MLSGIGESNADKTVVPDRKGNEMRKADITLSEFAFYYLIAIPIVLLLGLVMFPITAIRLGVADLQGAFDIKSEDFER